MSQQSQFSLLRKRRFLPFFSRNFSGPSTNAVQIAARHVDEEIYAAAFKRIGEYVDAGEMVCIFPEVKLTADGGAPVNPGEANAQGLHEQVRALRGNAA